MHLTWSHEQAHADSVRSILSRAAPSLVDASHNQLESLPHKRTITTTQLYQHEDTVAQSIRSYRITPENSLSSVEELRREDQGEFNFGWMGLFADRDSHERDAWLPPRDLIPDDPGYLAPRNFEDYRYRLLSDTSWNGMAAYGAEVALRSDADNTPNEHLARAIFSLEDHHLLFFSSLIIRETFLFNERTFTAWESNSQIRADVISPPRSTHVITWLDMPLASPREISTRTHFEYPGEE